MGNINTTGPNEAVVISGNVFMRKFAHDLICMHFKFSGDAESYNFMQPTSRSSYHSHKCGYKTVGELEEA